MTAVFSRLRLGTAAPASGGGSSGLKAENVFGVSSSVSTADYYTPGTGLPAISTADYYMLDGVYMMRPYDLDTMGSAGATVKAAQGGNRYVWLVSPDHPTLSSPFGWADGQDFRMGFSNDPGIPPDTFRTGLKEQTQISFGGQVQYMLYHAPYLVYNPDDGGTPFWMYAEGQASSIQHEEGVAKSADLVNWTVYGYTHKCNTFLDWTSFQAPVRVGTGDWHSLGFATFSNNLGGYGKWTSTDGQSFTQATSKLTSIIGNSQFTWALMEPFSIGGQTYLLAKEELWDGAPTGTTWWNGLISAGRTRLGIYISLVPIDSNFNALASPDVIRISDVYNGPYPGPGYMQQVSGYVEDGVLHIWAAHGFVPSFLNGLVTGVPYVSGGGLQEQFTDYYTYVIDSATAVTAAPIGVTASCDAGVVTVSWYDALPNRTYRVYKGSTSATQTTLVGDVTGTSITDSPTIGQWWYKVVTLDSGTERQNRVAHTYVSTNSELANRHVNRVIDDGGDVTTINQTWLQTCIDWAVDNDLDNCIEFWADAGFGVKLSAGKVVKVYCLGTTILPRGGDLTMKAANTTYSATGLNSTAPAWTNPNLTDQAYWGGQRVNNIRRKLQITMFAAYKKPDTSKASFISSDNGSNPSKAIGLEHVSGSPGNVRFYISDTTQTLSATATLASATGVNVIIGFFDGTNVTAYGNGVAGTPQTGLDPNLKLANATALRGLFGVNTPYPCVASGTSVVQYDYTNGRVYQRAEAKFTASCVGMFSTGLSDAQAISFDTMQATHIGR